MGFDLVANNEGVEDFQVGPFSWSWILNKCGVGLPLVTGPGLIPGMYIHRPCDTSRGSPQTNDGFKVSSEQALHMGLIAGFAVEYQRTLAFVWENRTTSEEREMWERINKDQVGYLNRPACERLVNELLEFSEWAKASGGFEIW